MELIVICAGLILFSVFIAIIYKTASAVAMESREHLANLSMNMGLNAICWAILFALTGGVQAGFLIMLIGAGAATLGIVYLSTIFHSQFYKDLMEIFENETDNPES